MRRWAWVAFGLLGAWDPVTKKQTDVAAGNQKLAAGKPAEAEKHYQKAFGELGALPGVLYDLGVAHYAAAQAMPPGKDKERGQLLESAEKELRLAGDAPETGLRSNAHYNLGNTLFAEEKFKDAIEEYKKSLRLQPDREDARHNLELALAKIPPPPPPQPKPQPSPKTKDDQDQAQKKQPSPDAKDQQKPDDGQNQDENQDQKQAGQEQKKPDPGSDEQKQQQKQAASGDQDKKPRPDDQQAKPSAAKDGKPEDRDTDRKLDLLEDRSKDLQVQKAQDRARQRRRGSAVKDW